MLIKDVINANLKRLRKVNGLTQKEAAKSFSIPFKRYQSYEEGRATPGFEDMKKIILFYEIDFNTFLSPIEISIKAA